MYKIITYVGRQVGTYWSIEMLMAQMRLRVVDKNPFKRLVPIEGQLVKVDGGKLLSFFTVSRNS